MRSAITAKSGTSCRPTAVAGEETLAAFEKAGIDIDALAKKLQDDGAESFVASWHELMAGIDAKTAAAKAAA